MTDFRTSDGCRIHFTVEGPSDLPALLLSNSLGTRMEMWSTQATELKRSFRLVRYDSRGHGQSDAPEGAYELGRLGQDVIELLDWLEIGVTNFCGLSLGGMVGQWLAVNAPQRINRLIIANSSPHLGPPSLWHARIALIRQGGLGTVAEAVIERWFTPRFRENSRERVAEIRDMLLATSVDGYCGCCWAIAGMDMRPFLERISKRCLVIAGSFDPATPREHSLAITRRIAGSQLVELAAAHLSNIEQPDQFTAVTSHFLASA